MPAPAVYVVTIIGVVAAGFAFKEFVYDPHIKPRIDARRRARARQRHGHLVPVPVSVVFNARRSSSSDDDGDDKRKLRDLRNMNDMGELKRESLFEMETLDWNSAQSRAEGSSTSPAHIGSVSASGVETDMGTLRSRNRRNPAAPLDSSINFELDSTFPPMVPTTNNSLPSTPTGTSTHIIGSSASASPSTTTSPSRIASLNPSRVHSPLPPLPHEVEPLANDATGSQPLRETTSPIPQVPMAMPPTPPSTVLSPVSDLLAISLPSADTLPISSQTPPSVSSSTICPQPDADPFSSPLIPSLSLSHPVDLAHDYERDMELVSVPSSRAISPPVSLGTVSSSPSVSWVGSDTGVGLETDRDLNSDSRPMSPFSTFSQVSSVADDEEDTRTNFRSFVHPASGSPSPLRSPFDGPESLSSSMASESSDGVGMIESQMYPESLTTSFQPPQSLGASMLSNSGMSSPSQSYYYTPSQSAYLPLSVPGSASSSPPSPPLLALPLSTLSAQGRNQSRSTSPQIDEVMSIGSSPSEMSDSEAEFEHIYAQTYGPGIAASMTGQNHSAHPSEHEFIIETRSEFGDSDFSGSEVSEVSGVSEESWGELGRG